jgi:hypothetical protein
MSRLHIKKIKSSRLVIAGLFLVTMILVFTLARTGIIHKVVSGSPQASLINDTEEGSASTSQLSQPSRQPTRSRVAPDVIRDYSYNAAHLMNGAGAPLYSSEPVYAQALSRLRQFPPDILIVGKEAPFTHSLGPVLSFGGENRTFPRVSNRKNEDPRRLLSPDELQLRIKATERFVQDAHSAGIKTVIPYISPMTMWGNAESRQGFFQFFDSWEKYQKEFQLGPRPGGDPVDWTQRAKDGSVYFRMGGGREDDQGMTRYSMCINNPDWRSWQMLLTNWIARVGYDGVWMDNVLVHRCYDKYCEMEAKKLGLDLRRDPDSVWLESYLRYFDDLRAEGSRRRPNFFLGGNYIEVPFQRAVGDKLDLTMIEDVWLGAARILWPGGRWTGYYPALPPNQKVLNNTQGSNDGQALNNIWLAQLAYAMRGDRGVHFLAGAPVGKGPTYAHNEDSAVLALAEAATFGGGAAVQVVGQYPLNSDTDLPAHKGRQRFFTFARAHRELYDQLLPAGNIAIVVFPDQAVANMVEAQQVHEALLWRGFLVDVLDGDKQNAATLAHYNLIIVPGQPQLPQWMKALPLLTSPDPLTPKEITDLKKTYQQQREAPQLRRTKLTELASERAAALRALVVPTDTLIEATAWANDQRMVLDILNFRTPIGAANAGKVTTVANIPAQLHVPKGKSVKQVRTFSVDGDQGEVAFEQTGDVLKFKIASVRVYQVIEIDFR